LNISPVELEGEEFLMLGAPASKRKEIAQMKLQESHSETEALKQSKVFRHAGKYQSYLYILFNPLTKMITITLLEFSRLIYISNIYIYTDTLASGTSMFMSFVHNKSSLYIMAANADYERLVKPTSQLMVDCLQHKTLPTLLTLSYVSSFLRVCARVCLVGKIISSWRAPFSLSFLSLSHTHVHTHHIHQ
jgi:hypothetical protein